MDQNETYPLGYLLKIFCKAYTKKNIDLFSVRVIFFYQILYLLVF